MPESVSSVRVHELPVAVAQAAFHATGGAELVRVTIVPRGNVAVHVASFAGNGIPANGPQVRPGGELLTTEFGEHRIVPPIGLKRQSAMRAMLRVSVEPDANSAFAFLGALIVRTQAASRAVPVQSPLQRLNEPEPDGAAVSVTFVPSLNDAVHVPGQLRPAGELVTVPAPPDIDSAVTVSV